MYYFNAVSKTTVSVSLAVLLFAAGAHAQVEVDGGKCGGHTSIGCNHSYSAKARAELAGCANCRDRLVRRASQRCWRSGYQGPDGRDAGPACNFFVKASKYYGADSWHWHGW